LVLDIFLNGEPVVDLLRVVVILLIELLDLGKTFLD
jgi:hypothetical protein